MAVKKTRTDLARKRFLVVDDFRDFRYSVKKMLQSFGAIDIDDVGDGDEAIAKLAVKNYDIILCDYNLGEEKKDGQQILEEGRERNLINDSTTFIMVTAENTQNMVMGALEYKPDAYLTKPFTRDILQQRLEKLYIKKGELAPIARSLTRKEYSKAMILIDEKLQSDLQNKVDLLKLKGETYLKMGDYKMSRETYKEVIDMYRTTWALLGLGASYYFDGKYMAAKDTFDEVIRENLNLVEAYDWLAKTYRKLGELRKAQEVLVEAVRISPKSILRQKLLGEIAMENGDYVTAEKAFRKAITLGRNSCFKAISNYVNLAKILREKGAALKAMKVLEESHTEFSGESGPSLLIAMAESSVFRELKDTVKAKSSLTTALMLYDSVSDELNPYIVMDLAKECFDLGEIKSAKKLVVDVVKSNFEDQDVVEKANTLLIKAGFEKEGHTLIESTKQESVKVNNTGVELVKMGKYDKAIEFFEKAIRDLPGSKIINANAAHALILYMQTHGIEDSLLYKCRKYIERLDKIAPDYKKSHMLKKNLEELLQKNLA